MPLTKVSKTETDSTIAPTASPAFTGVPTAPTAPAGTSTTQIATTAFVTGAISSIPSGSTLSPVFLHYSTNTSQSLGLSTTIVYEDLISNTHPGSYNTTTGQFTAPMTGLYFVFASFGTTFTTLATSSQLGLIPWVGATATSLQYAKAYGNGASQVYNVAFSGVVSLNANDVLTIRSNNNVTVSTNTASFNNQLQIFKVA
jgi:hypothetical protein